MNTIKFSLAALLLGFTVYISAQNMPELHDKKPSRLEGKVAYVKTSPVDYANTSKIEFTKTVPIDYIKTSLVDYANTSKIEYTKTSPIISIKTSILENITK